MFEDWETGQPDNKQWASLPLGTGEDCTTVTTPTRGRWNDVPCTLKSHKGDVLRAICKQEQTVWVLQEKVVLVIEKNFSDSRLKAENLQNF